jgi:hypothetical protein
MVKEWIESRKGKTEARYEEEKRKFEMAMGKPFITFKVELPTGFEDCRGEFLSLETDVQFHEEIKDLIKKRLLLEKHPHEQ